MLFLIQITAIVIAKAMGRVAIDVIVVIVAVIVINCFVLKLLSLQDDVMVSVDPFCERLRFN